MGQSASSSYVVEIAPNEQQAHKPNYDGRVLQSKQVTRVPSATGPPMMHAPRGWQPLATQEEEEERLPGDAQQKNGYAAVPSSVSTSLMPWRITVNPTAEDFDDNQHYIVQHQRRLIEQQQLKQSLDTAKQRQQLTDRYSQECASTSSTELFNNADRASNNQSPTMSTTAVNIPKERALNAAGFSAVQYRQRIGGVVNGLYGQSKILDQEESRSLVLALQLFTNEAPTEPHEELPGSAQKYADDAFLLRALTAIANMAAFASNQDLLREMHCLPELQRLLHEATTVSGRRKMSTSTRIMLVQAVGNMAVNVNNHRLLQSCVGPLCSRLRHAETPELEKIVCAQTLTNLSVHIDLSYVHHYTTVVEVLWARIWSGNKANMAMLKLLVNLSAEQVMCTWLLGAKSPPALHNLLAHTQPEEVLVRAATLLTNLCSAIDAACIDWPFIQHEMKSQLQVPHAHSILFAIKGPIGSVEFLRLCKLLKYHPNEEIAQRCGRLLGSISAYAERPEQCSSNTLNLVTTIPEEGSRTSSETDTTSGFGDCQETSASKPGERASLVQF